MRFVALDDNQRMQIIDYYGKKIHNYLSSNNLNLRVAVYDDDTKCYLTSSSFVSRITIRDGGDYDEYGYLVLKGNKVIYVDTMQNNKIVSLKIWGSDLDESVICKMIEYYERNSAERDIMDEEVLNKAIAENNGEEIRNYREWFISKHKSGFVLETVRNNEVFDAICNQPKQLGTFMYEKWYVNHERNVYVMNNGSTSRKEDVKTVKYYKMYYDHEVVLFGCESECNIYKLPSGYRDYCYRIVYYYVPKSLFQVRRDIVSAINELLTSEYFELNEYIKIKKVKFVEKKYDFFNKEN